MSREIKFRVWDKKYKKFIELSHHKIAALLTNAGLEMSTGWDGEDNPKFGETAQMKSYNEFLEYQKNFIYNQFTGLKDKNGKEIYEGDIVMASITIEVAIGSDFDYFNIDKDGNKTRISCSLKPSVVEYTEQGYIFKHITGKTRSFWIGIKDIKEKFEVVGNICENPELLKQEGQQ